MSTETDKDPSPSDADYDGTADKAILADRLDEAGFGTGHVIDVLDGEKGSPVEHDDPANRHDDPCDIDGNYGVYATGDCRGGLALLDVDDYGENTDTNGLAALQELPETLTAETPHTDGELGGHHLLKVESGDQFETAQEALEAVTGNKKACKPTWGDVKVCNGYVVGVGSQLEGCDNEWCDECETPEGGWYRISINRPIATITADEFADLLRADPQYAEQNEQGVLDAANTECAVGEAEGTGKGFSGPDADLLDRARDAKSGERFYQLFDRGDTSSYRSHSEARMALLYDLAFWTGGNPKRMDRLFRESSLYPPQGTGKMGAHRKRRNQEGN